MTSQGRVILSSMTISKQTCILFDDFCMIFYTLSIITTRFLFLNESEMPPERINIYQLSMEKERFAITLVFFALKYFCLMYTFKLHTFRMRIMFVYILSCLRGLRDLVTSFRERPIPRKTRVL